MDDTEEDFHEKACAFVEKEVNKIDTGFKSSVRSGQDIVSQDRALQERLEQHNGDEGQHDWIVLDEDIVQRDKQKVEEHLDKDVNNQTRIEQDQKKALQALKWVVLDQKELFQDQKLVKDQKLVQDKTQIANPQQKCKNSSSFTNVNSSGTTSEVYDVEGNLAFIINNNLWKCELEIKI